MAIFLSVIGNSVLHEQTTVQGLITATLPPLVTVTAGYCLAASLVTPGPLG